MRAYGLTIEEWEELFELQGRKCALCGTASVPIQKGWHTDHDDLGVRGILCKECNQTLGRFKDSADLLRKAADYVEQHGWSYASKFRKPDFQPLETRQGRRMRRIRVNGVLIPRS
jgi:hypothetical protein